MFRGVQIGCGFFAQNHLHAWAEQTNVSIAAVADRDLSRAEAAANRFGIAGAYSDAEQMLAAERPDFVDIVTGPSSHRALVELAASYAKLVVCQKPLADTYADGRSMVEAARRNGSTLLVHENFRWQRPYRGLVERLQAGMIGEPVFARISFRHGVDNYDNQPYLAEIERFALMDMGTHLFDLARYLVGEIDRITCITQRRNAKVRGEDAFTALLAHKGGEASTVDCSYASIIRPEPFPQTTAMIEGTAGSLSIGADYQLRHHFADGSEDADLEPEVPNWGARPWHGIQDSVRAYIGHVVDVLHGRSTGLPTAEHNLRTLAAALACYDSASTGTTIVLDDWIEAQS